MKKFVLTTFAVALLSGCATKTDTVKKANFTQQDFVGEWSCLIQYPELHMSVYDHIRLNADASMFDNEKSVVVWKKEPILTYNRVSQGKWELENSQLVFSFTSQKVTKNHPAATQKLLNDKKLVAKEKTLQVVQEMDDSFFKSLSSESYKTEKLRLNIVEFEPKIAFSLTQKIDGKEYRGLCLFKQNKG